MHLAPFEEDHSLYAWDAVNLTTTPGPLVTAPVNGTVDAMAYDDGLLYAVDADTGGDLPARLLRIDPLTGQAAVVLELPPSVRAVTAPD